MRPNVILAPTLVSVEIELDPIRNMLNSLSLISFVDYNYGIDEWMIRTAKTLPADVMHRHEVVFGGLIGVSAAMLRAGATSVEGLIAWLERIDAYEFREMALADNIDGMRELFAELKMDQRIPDSDEMLADQELYVEIVSAALTAQKAERAISAEALREAHRLFNDPPAMKATVASHLRTMWGDVFEPEWRRVLPMLEESVEAFRRLDFSGMTAIEAIRTVTGRDVRGILDDELVGVERLIFVPSAHIGPYLANLGHGATMWLVFRARVPEGVQPRSPEITRSELLVRVSALADDTRLRMLELLTQKDELCAQDIIEALDISQSAASRHLRQLSASGYLVERRSEGQKCYRLNGERIEAILGALAAFLMRK